MSAAGGLATAFAMKEQLEEQDYVYPVFFIGHGSPMNGIEDNRFSKQWKEQVAHLPVPKAVLVVSAHWLTRGTGITAMDFPPTIHDFGGFPQELFDVQYPAPGSPAIVQLTRETVKSATVIEDHDWGLDHGAWTVVRHMYPDANVPVLQLSIDYGQPASWHFQLGKELAELRKKGVLIIGSGNMIHNLRMVDFQNIFRENYGYDWAIEANDIYKQRLISHDFEALIDYRKFGKPMELSVPTPDHFFPLMYVLGAAGSQEQIHLFNDELQGGSLNMLSARIG